MNKLTRKQLVAATADAICKQNNKLSTKHLKLVLRNQYPHEQWNKYGNGQGVSDLFHELVREGKYKSVADNGTYQTYASTSYPVKDKKGDAFIADDPISTLTVQKVTLPAPKKAVKKAMKKTATKAKATVTVKVRGTNSSASVTKVTTNPVAIAKKLKKATKAALPSITKATAQTRMSTNKGRFFTAVFVKKDGTERSMSCQWLKDQNGANYPYVKVRDAALMKTQPTNCIRNVNLDTLVTLSIGGSKFKVK